MGTVIKTLTITTDDSGLQTLVDQANASIGQLNDLGTQGSTIVAALQATLQQIATFNPQADVTITDAALPSPDPLPSPAPNDTPDTTTDDAIVTS